MSIDNHNRDRKCGLVVLSGLEAFYCDLVPSNENRSTLVNCLIQAYQLHKLSNVEQIHVRPLSRKELVTFHDQAFVNFLMRLRNDVDDQLNPKMRAILDQLTGSSGDDDDEDCDVSDEEESTDTLEILTKYGLIYDCPVFPYMNKYIEVISGSTLSAVDWLMKNSTVSPFKKTIAMNWHGGRHHGHRDKASGFCYINDIVLAITRLRTRFSKVMYIDFDLHHGDGVSKAFKISQKVLTFSIHRYDVGFFPGTGSLERGKGLGNGSGYDINLPMRKGLSNKILLELVEKLIIPLIQQKFKPDCLVIQCGCDGLNTDEHKEWNLTVKGLGKIIDKILIGSSDIPTLLLGGGGYNHTELAKFWTYLTSVATGFDNEEWDIIPEHDQLDFYEKDSFEFWKNERETNMRDLNDDDEWLQYLIENVMSRKIE